MSSSSEDEGKEEGDDDAPVKVVPDSEPEVFELPDGRQHASCVWSL